MYNPQLETFLVVADAGSFNKAAAALFISPPAVMPEPTVGPLEQRYLQRSLQLIDLLERARAAMQSEENVIRIGTSPMTPAQSMVDLWPRFRERCPDLKFKVIPYENTPENAREILKNLGRNIDVVAGIFDERMLDYRQCAGTELCRVPLCCAVSVNHPLAKKEQLTVADLYGENLLLMHRGWSRYIDQLRDDLWACHPEIHIVDFDFYSVEIFNQCESSSDVLIAIENWKSVHPLLKILPVDWSYTIPFGILHAPEPSKAVQRFLEAIPTVMEL